MPTIRFFTQADNQSKTKTTKVKKGVKPVPLTGYVSATGKLVLPAKTVQAISNVSSLQTVRVGSPAGKRKLTVLYLIPTDEQDTEGFPVVVTPRGTTIDLAQILHGGGLDYKTKKYSFTLSPFTYQSSVTGYELQLTTQSDMPKAPYMGKLRGRKPKAK